MYNANVKPVTNINVTNNIEHNDFADNLQVVSNNDNLLDS